MKYTVFIEHYAQKHAYRIRVSDYRIIYEINDDRVIVTVVSVGHMKNIYK